MRQQGLHRLNSISVGKNRPDYIVMHFLINDLMSAIAKYATGKLLDVGCGNKPYESLFGKTVSSYVGCDVVQSDLNKVDVICEATQLKFEDSSCDTVFSTQVIEHVSNPFKMSEEMFRVLKSGGHLILSAPFAWELHEEPYDFFRYSKHGLKAMFEAAGFEIVEIVPNGGKWAAIIQLNLNILYSSFKRKSLLAKLLKGLFINCHFTGVVNRFGIWLDNKYKNDLLTLNYVVVCRKP